MARNTEQIVKRGNKYLARCQRKELGRGGVSKTFSTKGEARAWLRKINTEIDEGRYVDRRLAERTTLAEALDRYIDTVAVRKKGRGARENKYQANNIKKHEISNLPLARVRSEHVAKYREDRLKSVSKNTVRLELALLSHLFTIAKSEWGMSYLINPVSHMSPSTRGTERSRRLAPGEEEALLAACEEFDSNLYDVIVFAVETAARRSEIASLVWKDVDFQREEVTFVDTKNNEARIVPLSARALEVLYRRSKVRRIDDPRVFNLASWTISHKFKMLCSLAEISDLRFHDLRHEATSRLFERGLTAEEVMLMTGHKTYAMLKRYTHLRRKSLHQKLKKGS